MAWKYPDGVSIEKSLDFASVKRITLIAIEGTRGTGPLDRKSDCAMGATESIERHSSWLRVGGSCCRITVALGVTVNAFAAEATSSNRNPFICDRWR